MKNKNNKVYIPNKQQFPRPNNRKKQNNSQKTKQIKPSTDVIINNKSIDFKKLALLVNVCHLVADVNEQLVMDINDILKDADPRLKLQFERSIRQIKNHTADMVRFVDTKMDDTFSEKFGNAADALKEIIMNYINDSIVTNG
ncbi:hypothetical protein CLV62_104158 [Dysgonomonas alginatilytica]|uniref:Uncharacterized protein n=1 Tax=Dysgonomonas alginatilytica TaxID=1605892 RepID=A0A2V3PR84_9BACT|nr:hypothetical protein [Dysgonomonas alginatilytica]PXV66897.1 hypothetical protein CLV62_104158 [Dysgonomonas alginatilytica]